MVARSIASAAADPRQECALAVAGPDDGRLIGFGRLALDPHQPRAATFGFALNPDTWGNGFGTETVRLLLACAFEDLGLHRVWGAPSPSIPPPPAPWDAPDSPRRATSASTSNAAASEATRSPTPSSTTNTSPSQSDHGSRYYGSPAG
ncbi:GNAT family N-acetyltransferase [Streptomyces sp. D54]|uniref:GNAT family N-acetyltransferase n=1 Tax=Streptomyces sp. D54 TaxID=1290289 RepID=UPI003CF9F437